MESYLYPSVPQFNQLFHTCIAPHKHPGEQDKLLTKTFFIAPLFIDWKQSVSPLLSFTAYSAL